MGQQTRPDTYEIHVSMGWIWIRIWIWWPRTKPECRSTAQQIGHKGPKPRRILQVTRLRGQRNNNIEEEEDNGRRRVGCRCDLGTLPFNNNIFWSLTYKPYPLFLFWFCFVGWVELLSSHSCSKLQIALSILIIVTEEEKDWSGDLGGGRF